MTTQADVSNGERFDDWRQEQLAEQSWSMQAAADREKAIAVIVEARRRIREIRVLLDTRDKQLSAQLQPFQHLLDERLGALLVCREDTRT
jgi:hypothetical protein